MTPSQTSKIRNQKLKLKISNLKHRDKNFKIYKLGRSTFLIMREEFFKSINGMSNKTFLRASLNFDLSFCSLDISESRLL
jgi:hypothetical protein